MLSIGRVNSFNSMIAERDAQTSVLLADLYQLTRLQAYFDEMEEAKTAAEHGRVFPNVHPD